MKTLELFCGTKSFTKYMDKIDPNHKHDHITLDYDGRVEPDIEMDINRFATDEELDQYLLGYGQPDIIWASPDCTAYSIAGCSHHWDKIMCADGVERFHPKSQKAKDSKNMIISMAYAIRFLQPKLVYVENPRGLLRKMPEMQLFESLPTLNIKRHTITYCQYGDTRMKPTDIWTNDLDWVPRPMCKNGDPCHVPGPRGSKTAGSTQGLKNRQERGRIPEDLFKELAEGDKFQKCLEYRWVHAEEI